MRQAHLRHLLWSYFSLNEYFLCQRVEMTLQPGGAAPLLRDLGPRPPSSFIFKYFIKQNSSQEQIYWRLGEKQPCQRLAASSHELCLSQTLTPGPGCKSCATATAALSSLRPGLCSPLARSSTTETKIFHARPCKSSDLSTLLVDRKQRFKPSVKYVLHPQVCAVTSQLWSTGQALVGLTSPEDPSSLLAMQYTIWAQMPTCLYMSGFEGLPACSAAKF